jgi:predicted RNA-binding protein with PUA-like domain
VLKWLGFLLRTKNSALITNEHMNYWLVKQEPEAYSFDDLVRDGKTDWTGVRNFQARNNLRAMRAGDPVLFYHSVSEKAIVGMAEVSREEFTDPGDEKWIAVEIKAVEKFAKPVSLERIKASEKLENIALIKQSRLSVMPLTAEEYAEIRRLAE